MIEKNVEKFLKFAERVEVRTGRKIFVVGASKTRSVEEINLAVSSGLTMVGENRPQELRDKFEHIDKRAEVHFIGQLQANKIKYVVGKAALIHSVDSIKTAELINARSQSLGIVQDCLLEINICRDEAKQGFDADGLVCLISELLSLKNLRFRGLMTILPKGDEGEIIRKCDEMKALYDRLCTLPIGRDFCYLSMGMSEDYELAVSRGANMIRIGRGIFGERNGKN